MPDDSQPAAHTEWKSLNSKNPCIRTKDIPNTIIFSKKNNNNNNHERLNAGLLA